MPHNRRLYWLGDRLLDALENCNLREQKEVPPGLVRQINEWRWLLKLGPRRYRTVSQAHAAVLDAQEVLLPELEVDQT